MRSISKEKVIEALTKEFMRLADDDKYGLEHAPPMVQAELLTFDVRVREKHEDSLLDILSNAVDFAMDEVIDDERKKSELSSIQHMSPEYARFYVSRLVCCDNCFAELGTLDPKEVPVSDDIGTNCVICSKPLTVEDQSKTD